VVSFSKSVK